MSEEPVLMRFGGFELDEANATLKRGAEALELQPKAFAVLCELARRPGKLMTKDALLDAVWGHRHVSESVLKSAVRQLRIVIGDDAKAPQFIETASRRGYRFIAPGGPDGATRGPAVPAMTGRAPALARLQAAWERACEGQRQLCWLAGEAGIGKTTLVDHFAASLATSIGAPVGAVSQARGQCVEQRGPGEPYLPVFEALADLCRRDPDLVGLMRGVAPSWLLQLPWLCTDAERESLQRELAGTSQDRMLREFGELLDRYAQAKPLLLITEDLQWSDHATVNLINHAARRRGAARWMWLTTFRAAEVAAADHPVSAMRHEWRLHRLGEEIAVEPFSEQESADYIAHRLGGAAWPAAFVQALHRHTDGLPLFVAHVIDEMLTLGALQAVAPRRDAHLRFDSLSVPESLAGVIERQIERLPADQTALLEAASACGLEFRPALVARLIERDAEWVAAQCELLAHRRQWLVQAQMERGPSGSPQARYAFRHALVRHVFHDRLSPLARARLHLRVAQVLTQAGEQGAAVSAAELAMHFELAQDPDAALPHLAEAAANALQHFAPADALRLADGGLECAERCRPGAAVQGLRATLRTLRGASAALVLGVTADETWHSFERAHAAMEEWPRHPLRSLALHGLGLSLFLRGGAEQALELGQSSLACALQHDDAVMTVAACDVWGQSIKLQGPVQEAIQILEQGLQAAATLDEATLRTGFVLDPLVNLHAALAIPLLLSGQDRRSRAHSGLALARADALKQPMARMLATWLAALCEMRRGARERVAAMAAQLRAITDEGALASGEGPSEWFAGLVQAWSGEPLQGYRRIERAYQRNAQLGRWYRASEVLGYAAEALMLAGDAPGAQRQLDEAMALADDSRDRSYRPQLLLLKRRIALVRGAAQEAAEAGRAALLEARSQQSPWLELTVLADLCESQRAEPEHIAALRAVVVAMPEQSDAPLMNRARALQG